MSKEAYIAHAENIPKGTFRIYVRQEAELGQMTLTNEDLRFVGDSDEYAHVLLASGIVLSTIHKDSSPIILVNSQDYYESETEE